jgi:ring-1,2-phenylacetyl-CoA epoxidase subunit PaaA
VPDPELRKDEETDRWSYTEPDWDELMSVVTGHGPKTEERLDLRRQARENSGWIRSIVLREAA